MIRIPRNSLKTAQDYECMHAMALSGELRPSCGHCLRRYWESLLNGRWRYDRDRLLEDGEDPDGPEPDYRVVTEETEDGATERRQYKRVRDNKARIDQLGFDAETVEAKIAELDEVLE